MVEQAVVHLRSSVAEDGQKHEPQIDFVESKMKRICIKAGRRGGKTVGIAKRAVKRFLSGRRQLYGAPTKAQVDTFWFEVKRALREPIEKGAYKLNETEHYIEKVGTKQRIKAKTCWNANTLRGDYADDLYLDEFQLMAEDTWADVGEPMLADYNGDAVFIFTPPSLATASKSRARDPRHASKLYKEKAKDTTGLWQTIHFSSHANPFISKEALSIFSREMSPDSYRREIEAMDDDIEQSWVVYGMFNEGLCKINRFEIPKNWTHFSGHDFGKANPAGLFMSQNPGPEEPRTSRGGLIRKGDFVVWQEYLPGAGFSVFDHVTKFKEIMGGRDVTRSVGGNNTTEDEIRQAYQAHGWPIYGPKYNYVGPQIDKTIGMFRLGKIHIFDDMHHLLHNIANCLWKLDEENQPTDKIDNEAKWHLLAALRTLCSDFASETEEYSGDVTEIHSLEPARR